MANSTSPINSPIKGRTIECNIIMLDDSIEIFTISAKSDGRVLYKEIINKMQLIEFDYFDLQYTDSELVQCWLDKEKLIVKQVSGNDFTFKFLVKFYTPDPGLLEEEYTRYLFALQIKRDLRLGHLICQEHTAILMASFILQAELGDYTDDLVRQNYIAGVKLLPNHSAAVDYKICLQHQEHMGQSQMEADFNLLDTARKVELYGIRMNQARDSDGIVLSLAVTHAGIMVFQNLTKINFFSWAKIRKLCFKRKKFIVKLHPDGNAYNKDSIEFYFTTRNVSKNFWKQCIEHHAFFRCHTVRSLHKNKSKVVSRGSSFRYTGRTQKELVEYVREHPTSNSPFERSMSMRTVSMTTSRAGTPKGGNFQTMDYGSQTLDRPYGSYQNQLAYPVTDHQINSTLSPNSDRASQPNYNSRTLPNFPSQKNKQSSFNSHDTSDAVLDPNQFMLPTLNGQNHQFYNNKKPISEYLSYPKTYSSLKYSSNQQDPFSPAPYGQISMGSAIPNMDERGVLSGVFHESEKVTSSSISSPEYLDPDLKKKLLLNFDYTMLKEIITTERTFRKDLEIICVHLRDHVNDMIEVSIFFREFLLNLFEPLYENHCHLLNEFNQLLNAWETNSSLMQRENATEKTLLRHLIRTYAFYTEYLNQLDNLMAQYHSSIKNQPQFEEMVSSFEMKKICYLPLSVFFLRPIQRLLHYKQYIERLLNHHSADAVMNVESKECLMKLLNLSNGFAEQLLNIENDKKLNDIQRDITNGQHITVNERFFIREGSLLKLTKKGFQQRLFVLFSDILIFLNRVSSSSLQFKIKGQLQINGMRIIQSDEERSAPSAYSFTIESGNDRIVCCANSGEEKAKWIEDISQASFQSTNSNNLQVENNRLSFFSNDSDDSLSNSQTLNSPEHQVQHRSNTTLHVCWHRSVSVGIKDIQTAFLNQMSSYLLRKFKNSNGWQKLWVVFTDFCLFFYKNSQEDQQLASLPLLGYAISLPNETDMIDKEFVFKLQFKNHVYFFRTDGEICFRRWCEVIHSVTSTSRNVRTFSRIESSSASPPPHQITFTHPINSNMQFNNTTHMPRHVNSRNNII